MTPLALTRWRRACCALLLLAAAWAERPHRLGSDDGYESLQAAPLQPELAAAAVDEASASPEAFVEGGEDPCLCSFDVKHTLVTEAVHGEQCPGNQRTTTDTLSEWLLAPALADLKSTACSKCYLAIVGVGDADAELRDMLVEHLKASGGRLPVEDWTGPAVSSGAIANCHADPRLYNSTLVLGCMEGTKHEALAGVLKWLNAKHSARIPESRVWHFDDSQATVQAFHGSGFNARQVSCGSPGAGASERAEAGLCGAGKAEIALEGGLNLCPPPDVRPGGEGSLFKAESDQHLSGPDSGNDPDYEVFENRIATNGHGGRHLLGWKLLSMEGCQEWCSETSECDCVTYQRPTGRCWLKTHCRSEAWSYAAHHAVAWKVRTGEDARPDPKFHTLHNQDPQGLDELQFLHWVEPEDIVSPEACQATCSRLDACGCAVYVHSTKRCTFFKECKPKGSRNASSSFVAHVLGTSEEEDVKKEVTTVFNKIKQKGVDIVEGFKRKGQEIVESFKKLGKSFVKGGKKGSDSGSDSSDDDSGDDDGDDGDNGDNGENGDDGDDSGHTGGNPGGTAVAGCKTATKTNGMEECYEAVMNAKNEGCAKGEDYGGLTSSSSFEDFQNWFAKQDKGSGEKPKKDNKTADAKDEKDKDEEEEEEEDSFLLKKGVVEKTGATARDKKGEHRRKLARRRGKSGQRKDPDEGKHEGKEEEHEDEKEVEQEKEADKQEEEKEGKKEEEEEKKKVEEEDEESEDEDEESSKRVSKGSDKTGKRTKKAEEDKEDEEDEDEEEDKSRESGRPLSRIWRALTGGSKKTHKRAKAADKDKEDEDEEEEEDKDEDEDEDGGKRIKKRAMAAKHPKKEKQEGEEEDEDEDEDGGKRIKKRAMAAKSPKEEKRAKVAEGDEEQEDEEDEDEKEENSKPIKKRGLAAKRPKKAKEAEEDEEKDEEDEDEDAYSSKPIKKRGLAAESSKKGKRAKEAEEDEKKEEHDGEDEGEDDQERSEPMKKRTLMKIATTTTTPAEPSGEDTAKAEEADAEEKEEDEEDKEKDEKEEKEDKKEEKEEKKEEEDGATTTEAPTTTTEESKPDMRKGCTMKACPPAGPSLPSGFTVRVAKALGSRGYNKVRVSVVHYKGSGGSGGDVKWTYNSQFKHRWTNCHIKSAVIDVEPGVTKSLSVAGETISIKIPKQDEGSIGLIMADPCHSCGDGKTWNLKDTTAKVIDYLAGKGELDYWITVGDNWYDIKGDRTQQLWKEFSRRAQSVPFAATMGNHDYCIGGSPGACKGFDSFGNGHLQWYAGDTMASKDDEAKFYDSSKAPHSYPHVSNTFWYHSMGNAVLIGFANNYQWGEQESYFKEACSYAGKVKPKIILLFGHWSYSGFGVVGGMDTNSVYNRMKNFPGCSGKLIRYIIGHTHENKKVAGPHFMLGSWGFGGGDGRFGISLLDTRGGRAKLHYFKMGEGHRRRGDWEKTMNCFKEKGVTGCTHLGSYEKWMDESI